MSNIDYKSLPIEEIRKLYYKYKKDHHEAYNEFKAIREKRDSLKSDIDSYDEIKNDANIGYAAIWEAKKDASDAFPEYEKACKKYDQMRTEYNDVLHDYSDAYYALKDYYSPIVKKIINHEFPSLTEEEAHDLLDIYIPLAADYQYGCKQIEKSASSTELPKSHEELTQRIENEELYKKFDKKLRETLAILQYADRFIPKKEDKKGNTI